MTGNARSTLAREADVHLDVGVAKEACPLGLAPTSSTTAALAMGDALAVAMLETRGFTQDDFALSHPGGALGRRLLLRVADLQHAGDAAPRVPAGSTLAAALDEMTAKGLGMTAVVDPDGRVVGVFTDGDLRRALDRDVDLRGAVIDDLMSRAPRTVTAHMLAAEAVHLMETHRINALLVTGEDGSLQGALNMHDLLRAGVV